MRRRGFLIILSVIPLLFRKRHKDARVKDWRINGDENKRLNEIHSLIRELDLTNDVNRKIELIIELCKRGVLACSYLHDFFIIK